MIQNLHDIFTVRCAFGLDDLGVYKQAILFIRLNCSATEISI